MRIPLPPLEEQRRIVSQIDELHGSIEEVHKLHQQATEEADALWESSLAATF